MYFDRLRYELHIMGKWVIFIPLLMMLSFAFLAGLLIIMHVDLLRISQVLTASLEMVLPLAAGLLTATIISHDAAIELQLTMPKLYRMTAFVRLGWVIVWTNNRFELLITALVLLFISWFMLNNTEKLLQGSAGEE